MNIYGDGKGPFLLVCAETNRVPAVIESRHTNTYNLSLSLSLSLFRARFQPKVTVTFPDRLSYAQQSDLGKWFDGL
jgi:hypothetical protein